MVGTVAVVHLFIQLYGECAVAVLCYCGFRRAVAVLLLVVALSQLAKLIGRIDLFVVF